ncbi:MAG: FAD/NAD(P)-binding protein [Pyrinomonadaceae bacterium]
MAERDRKAVIAIVGGGLSGTLVAAHLLSRKLTRDAAARARPLRVVIVERFQGKLARGVAYSTNDRVHLLNVPACNMSAFPEDSDHFLRWCQRNNISATKDTFVPRMLYGDYLEDVLQEAEDSANAGNSLERITDEVTAIDADEQADCAMLRLKHRGALYADRVVIAPGNYAPAHPHIPGATDFYAASPAYIRDPWKKDALSTLDLSCPILLIGTGLTMVDVALSLRTRGLRARLFAVSRHGLLPQSHREAQPIPSFDFSADDVTTIRALCRRLRERIERAHDDGYDWRACVNALRPLTQKLWQSLDAVERRRFLRHVRPRWEVHRHRMAPEVGAHIGDLISDGQLLLHAGRITSFREVEGEVEVTFRERGCEGINHVLQRVGYVINCTGPASDVRRIDDPLVRHLVEYNYATPDELGLGIEVSDNGSLINKLGDASSTLFTLGPWCKPLLWETTAAPEIRAQAAALADHLASSLGAIPASSRIPLTEASTVPREQSVYDWVI